jgi:hypothetical protein
MGMGWGIRYFCCMSLSIKRYRDRLIEREGIGNNNGLVETVMIN